MGWARAVCGSSCSRSTRTAGQTATSAFSGAPRTPLTRSGWSPRSFTLTTRTTRWVGAKLDTFKPSFDLILCLLSPAKTNNFKPVVLVTFLILFLFYLFASINTVTYNQLRWCSTCYYVETLHWHQYNYTTHKYYIDNYVKIM